MQSPILWFERKLHLELLSSIWGGKIQYVVVVPLLTVSGSKVLIHVLNRMKGDDNV